MSERRTLAILAAAALVSTGLAVLALRQQAQEGAPQFAPSEFLPGFAAQVKNAARIHIVSHDGAFDIAYTPDKGWVLPERGNYPADFDEVRHTLIGLAALETIEPKTARADWLHYVGLETPPKGNGVLIQVKAASGRELASLIMGNMESIGDPNGAAGLFVRRPNETQSWLARAVFVPHGAPSDWMLLNVLNVDAARLKDVTIAPAAGKSFTLARAHMSDVNFAVSPPLGNASPQVLNAITTAITGFTASDAHSAAQLDFRKSVHVTAHTFDGLSLSMDVVASGPDIWARLSAAAGPDAVPGIAKEARDVNARAGGWAYKLPPDKGRLLMATEAMLGGTGP